MDKFKAMVQDHFLSGKYPVIVTISALTFPVFFYGIYTEIAVETIWGQIAIFCWPSNLIPLFYFEIRKEVKANSFQIFSYKGPLLLIEWFYRAYIIFAFCILSLIFFLGNFIQPFEPFQNTTFLPFSIIEPLFSPLGGDNFILFHTLILAILSYRRLLTLFFKYCMNFSSTTHAENDAKVSKSILEDFLKKVPNEKRYVLRGLERKANQLKQRAAVILLVIIGLISGGIYISIFEAGNVVNAEGGSTNKLELVSNLINTYENRIENAKSANGEAQRSKSLAKAELIATGVVFSNEGVFDLSSATCINNAVTKKITSAPEFVVCATIESNREAALKYDFATNSITQTDELIGRLRTTIALIENKTMAEISKLLPEIQTNTTDVSILIASGITRFGILFVVIYLVQHLVGIYKYSLKLAAHYDTLADSLALSKDNDYELIDTISSLTPTNVDFGKPPTSPSENILSMIRSLLKQEEKAKPQEVG